MAIDQSIAEECVDFALFFGVNPHYLIAVGHKRSKLTDPQPAGGLFGPFQLSAPEWDANRNDAEFQFNFSADKIVSWRRTCDVFALMTYRTQNAFMRQNLNALPSVLDLYITQWPMEAKDPDLAAELQASLDATAPLVAPAAATLDDPSESGGVLSEPTAPIEPPTPTNPPSRTSFGTGPFRLKAPTVMKALMDDFPLNAVQAAGIVGNLGQESGGFRIFHERGQPPNKGGVGWAQWTGPRRRDFESFCQTQRLDPTSDAASYGFLRFELTQTAEQAVLKPLRKANNLNDAVEIFMTGYERPGVPAFPARLKFAQIAFDAFQDPVVIGGKMA
ncbi:phage tail tip lysozyme [Mesorhizobium sp.]|uniref:phage tail tip lysozyme n=1 Tax=Mesorhizobium sp. TaxID=1871066 RepID=UPI000FE45D51|nr:phage tail tip lysozyme [Mesorhizobium sp.]RWE78124.1 MAG: hypothetical protein EOS42_06255 [Mesorhizobium sp.]